MAGIGGPRSPPVSGAGAEATLYRQLPSWPLLLECIDDHGGNIQATLAVHASTACQPYLSARSADIRAFLRRHPEFLRRPWDPVEYVEPHHFRLVAAPPVPGPPPPAATAAAPPAAAAAAATPAAAGEPRRTPQGEGAALASDPSEDEDLAEERAARKRRYEKRPSATYSPEVNAAMANVATRLRARSPDDLTQERPAGRARWRPHTGTGESRPPRTHESVFEEDDV